MKNKRNKKEFILQPDKDPKNADWIKEVKKLREAAQKASPKNKGKD